MNLDKFKLIFWDFDGVIKESISVKTEAFIELFKHFGNDLCNKVKIHHLENGGISRYEKIPLYLEWSGVSPDDEKVNEFLIKFEYLVKRKVINSPWVPGVYNFLKKNHKKYVFILISATPHEEIKEICKAIKIDKYFYEIYGSPTSKSQLIKNSIDKQRISPECCLMFGDAQTDINAAKENKIDFILRKNLFNKHLNLDSNFSYIYDFNI